MPGTGSDWSLSVSLMIRLGKAAVTVAILLVHSPGAVKRLQIIYRCWSLLVHAGSQPINESGRYPGRLGKV